MDVNDVILSRCVLHSSHKRPHITHGQRVPNINIVVYKTKQKTKIFLKSTFLSLHLAGHCCQTNNSIS